MRLHHAALIAAGLGVLTFGAVVLSPHNSGILPNALLTPGATNPAVTQATIQKTICSSGWTATIRPPSSYTTALKIKQITQYGYKDTKTADYEEDHLISLELGGAPEDPQNLWPQSYHTTPNARDKDKVEDWLHSRLCTGQLTLSAAQQMIRGDWTKVYKTMKPQFSGTIQVTDPDDETN